MIRHQNSHPKLLCMCDFINRRNSVITGDDRVDPALISLSDQMVVYPIAVLHAVRYLRADVRAAPLQPARKNVGCHHTVNIIIADDTDRQMRFDLFLQNRGASVRIMEQVRVIQIVHASVYVFLHRRISDDLTVADQTCRDRTDQKSFRNARKVCSLLYYDPFFHASSSPYVTSSSVSPHAGAV